MNTHNRTRTNVNNGICYVHIQHTCYVRQRREKMAGRGKKAIKYGVCLMYVNACQDFGLSQKYISFQI